MLAHEAELHAREMPRTRLGTGTRALATSELESHAGALALFEAQHLETPLVRACQLGKRPSRILRGAVQAEGIAGPQHARIQFDELWRRVAFDQPREPFSGTAQLTIAARLALADYKPFWRLDAVPTTTAVRFIVAESDDFLDNAVNARAAALELKGAKDVQVLPGALHQLTPAQTAAAARLAAEWFREKL